MEHPETASAPVSELAVAEKAVADAQAYVDRLNELVPRLRAQLEAERAEKPPTLKALRARRQAAKAQRDEILDQIKAIKKKSKAIKQTIKARKQEYEHLKQTDKQGAWKKLKKEILKEHAPEIKALEDQIGALQPKHWEAQAQVEAVKVQIEAVRAGLHKRPVDEDPRLLGLLKAQEEAKKALEAAKKEYTEAAARVKE